MLTVPPGDDYDEILMNKRDKHLTWKLHISKLSHSLEQIVRLKRVERFSELIRALLVDLKNISLR